MPTQIQLRRGSAATWTSTNPILADGEMGVESDTGRFKVGNGVNTWTALGYNNTPFNPAAPGAIGGTTPSTGAFTTLTATGAITSSSTLAGTNLSGTNTGDNAVNSNYASDYRAANFVAGTNYVAPTGSDAIITRHMLRDCAFTYFDSSTTNALDYTNGSMQRWAPNTGAQTLSITNWPPTGNLGELLIQGVNLGAATITWPTINWVTSTGAFVTTFASNGVTLQTSGMDFILLWTRDAGTTIYGKVIR